MRSSTVYTTVALLRYMFQDRVVSPDELWATGATFTVAAWAFAYTFMAVQVIWPGVVRRHDARTCADVVRDGSSCRSPTDQRRTVRHQPSLPRCSVAGMIEQVAGLMDVALVVSDRRPDDPAAARLTRQRAAATGARKPLRTRTANVYFGRGSSTGARGRHHQRAAQICPAGGRRVGRRTRRRADHRRRSVRRRRRQAAR